MKRIAMKRSAMVAILILGRRIAREQRLYAALQAISEALFLARPAPCPELAWIIEPDHAYAFCSNRRYIRRGVRAAARLLNDDEDDNDE